MQSLVELATIGHDRIGPRTRQLAGPQNGIESAGYHSGDAEIDPILLHTLHCIIDGPPAMLGLSYLYDETQLLDAAPWSRLPLEKQS